MKSSFLVALLLAATVGDRAVAQDGPPPSLAFTDVHIVDVEAGEVLPRQTVLITGNRIQVVGDVEDVPLPSEARVIDGSGRYLVPGLWDMHTHNFDLTGGYELEHQFALLVANGVLGVRDVGASGLTLEEIGRIREEISLGQRLGPRIIAAGPLVDGPERRHVFSVVPRDPDHARIVVDSLAEAGADFIKVYANLRPDVYRALTDQANRRGIPFAGHLPERIPLREAVDRGQRSFEHLHAVRWACSDAGDELSQAFNRWDRAVAAGADTIPAAAELNEISDRLKTTYDDGACRSQLAYMAHGGVALVPTMVEYRKDITPPYELERDPRLGFVLPATRDWWDEAMWEGAPPTREEWEAVRDEGAATRRMHERVRGLIPLILESGVLLLAGTDINNEFTFPGFSLHDELEAFVDAGLSPAEALRTATLNPAAFLAAKDSLGAVAPGRLADLVLLEADPLQEIANTRRIAAVVANGRYLDRDELDRMLRGVAQDVATARDALDREPGSADEVRPYQRPVQLDDGWRAGAPEEVSRSREPLEKMTEALRRDEYPNVHAVLIAKDGRLIYEEYFEGTAWLWRDGQREAVSTTFDRETLYEVRSVTKSVTSAVFGVALGGGAIASVEDSPFDYLPDYAQLGSQEKRGITLRHALTMSAGLRWDESLEAWDDEERMYADPDPVGFVLSLPIESEPGTRWNYSGGLTSILGFVIARATGESFGEYARARLFEPLGITEVEWGWRGTAEVPQPGEDGSIYVSSCCRTAWEDVEEFRWDGTDPWSSVASPPVGLWIRARDLLKIGSLYVTGGRWNGRQVLPESWVEESLAPHIDRSDPPSEEHGHGVVSHRGYGYQWYHDRYALPYGDLVVHAAYGNGGQAIWVVPELDLVAIQVAGNHDLWYADYQAERLLLERIIPWALGTEATYRHEISRPVHALEPGEWSSVTITPDERALYVGSYDFAGERTQVYEEDGGLRMELPGQGAVDLLPEGDHVFVAGLVDGGAPSKIYWPSARLRFVLDEGGNVGRFEWREVVTGNVTSVGTRVR